MSSRKRSRDDKNYGANHFRHQAREGVRLRPEDSSSSEGTENEIELGTPTPTRSVARISCIGKQKLELIGTLPKLIVLDLDKTASYRAQRRTVVCSVSEVSYSTDTRLMQVEEQQS